MSPSPATAALANPASTWQRVRDFVAPGVFVTAFLLLLPLRDLTIYVNPGIPQAHVVVQVAVLAIALASAAFARPGPPWSRSELVCLLAALAFWFLATILSLWRGEFETWSYLIVGFFLALALLIRPTQVNVPAIVTWFGIGILGLMLISAALAGPMGKPSLTSAPDLLVTFANGYERPGRWQAFYLYVMSMAMTGACMVIIATMNRGWRRIALVIGGVALIVLALQRSAIFATLMALLPLTWYSSFLQASRRRRAIFGVLVGAGIAALVVAALVRDPDLNTRVPVWRSILAALPEHWPLGLGSAGLDQLPAAQILGGTVHAHDALLDAFARSGVLAFALLVTVFVAALRACLQAAHRGVPQPLALVVLVIVYGLADLSLDPRIWNESWALLLLALLISAWSRNRLPGVQPGLPILNERSV